MNKFTRIISIGGMLTFVGMLWYASASGFGLAGFSDRQSLEDRSCPDHLKDRFGNCPPRSHRRSLGARFYGGGGK